jgi:hypothetical protein
MARVMALSETSRSFVGRPRTAHWTRAIQSETNRTHFRKLRSRRGIGELSLVHNGTTMLGPYLWSTTREISAVQNRTCSLLVLALWQKVRWLAQWLDSNMPSSRKRRIGGLRISVIPRLRSYHRAFGAQNVREKKRRHRKECRKRTQFYFLTDLVSQLFEDAVKFECSSGIRRRSNVSHRYCAGLCRCGLGRPFIVPARHKKDVRNQITVFSQLFGRFWTSKIAESQSLKLHGNLCDLRRSQNRLWG